LAMEEADLGRDWDHGRLGISRRCTLAVEESARRPDLAGLGISILVVVLAAHAPPPRVW
jgi:hypothetical protein